MKYTYSKNRHYFNDLLFTPWPFCIGICLFMCVYECLLICNKHYYCNVNISLFLVYITLTLMCYSIFAWCTEVVHESFYGKYTKKLRAALVFGFLLFLVSEAMLFGSIFWAYFDRLFHLSYITGFLSVPTTVETIRWYKEPLYATIVLLASGWSSNYAYYLFQIRDMKALKKAYLYSLITNILGCIFLYIQYIEYTHLDFTITDTVYSSVFYVLTGFHGFHVIIGNFFLFIQYILKFIYIDYKVHALGYAVLYWHFVDIIWIFLFLAIYLFNHYDYAILTDYLY